MDSGTAGDDESVMVCDGEAAFLAGNAAGGLPRRAPSMMPTGTGAGDSGGPASLWALFSQERAGGTGTEAVVAWGNSANARSMFWTRVPVVGRVLEKIGHEQGAL